MPAGLHLSGGPKDAAGRDWIRRAGLAGCKGFAEGELQLTCGDGGFRLLPERFEREPVRGAHKFSGHCFELFHKRLRFFELALSRTVLELGCHPGGDGGKRGHHAAQLVPDFAEAREVAIAQGPLHGLQVIRQPRPKCLTNLLQNRRIISASGAENTRVEQAVAKG